jgi:manganese/zinc/iron transport system permease protein
MSLFEAFSWDLHVVDPWRFDAIGSFWIVLMGWAVAAASGLIGTFLLLRRLSLLGDALSHSLLPGIVVGFLLAGTRNPLLILGGALGAALLASLCIQILTTTTRLKTDAILGTVFTTFFAAGMVLISLYTAQVDLDAECVLYGEIGFIALEPPVQLGSWSLAPWPLVQMILALGVVVATVTLGYRYLMAGSFDPIFARASGLPTGVTHAVLLLVVAVVAVSAFEAVGVILVIAMLVFPPATASLFTRRLPPRLAVCPVLALWYSLGGYHLATWLDASIAASMASLAFATYLALLAAIRSAEALRRSQTARLSPQTSRAG